MVYVGKEAGFHTRTQDEIHTLLCRFADAGASVLRLKGGDPYIFGRGGEEALHLRERGIAVHCVPGALQAPHARSPRSACVVGQAFWHDERAARAVARCARQASPRPRASAPSWASR